MDRPVISATLSALFQPSGLMANSHRIIVAVSGGKDSMCLLHGLLNLRETNAITIIGVHFNHHLRPDSGEDETLVASFCEKYNVSFYSRDLQPAEKPQNKNLEEWCREQRYRILEQYRKRERADWILTAHHAKDQAETLMMHLAQGSGVNGLQGIRFRQGHVLRPFLSVMPSEIEAYVQRFNVPYREDSTNRDEKLNRNFLRLNVLPELEKRFPGIYTAALRTSRIMQETETAIQYSLKQLKQTIGLDSSANCIVIPRNHLENVPLLLQVRLLQDLCRTDERLRNHDWNELKQFLQNSRTGTVVTVGSRTVLRDRDRLIIEKPESVADEVVTWDMDSHLTFQGRVFQSRQIRTINHFPPMPDTELVNDAYLVGKKIQIRHWKPGDRFVPLGMRHRKKISDFLTDSKADLFSKRRQLVMTADDEIVWVCGQRISDTVKIHSDCKSARELTMRPMA